MEDVGTGVIAEVCQSRCSDFMLNRFDEGDVITMNMIADGPEK